MLQPTTIKATLVAGLLVARHEHYATRVEVTPPARRETESGRIRAVVRVTSEIPRQILEILKSPETTAMWNKFASLGALTSEHGKAYVGSRLTIYESEDAWRSLHLPLLLFTIISGAEALLGSMRRTFAQEDGRGGVSEWTERDFETAQRTVSKVCFCTTGGLGMTSEFGLSEGAVGAAAGHNTALFQLIADEPHPELGGGLVCLLEMPHQISNDERLRQVCVRLNNLEMATDRLPPHFGAWCAGQSGNKPAYVSFLPNALRIWNNSQCRVLGAGSGAMGQFNARVAADLRVVASYRLRAKTRTS